MTYTSRRPRVLVDCDGVLADFMSSALRIINRELDSDHMLDDVTEFDFAKALGLSAEDAARVRRAIGNEPRLAAGLGVLAGATDGMRALRSVADVYIVTSSWDSNETWEFDRKAWLRHHFNIRHHEIAFTAAKHICAGDVFVDDKTETLVTWQAEYPSGVAVQWKTPHNRRDEWDGWRTSSWDDVIAIAMGSVR